MKQSCLILLMFFFFTSNCQTTDSLKNKFINQTITRYGSFFQKGNERLLYKDLSYELKKSELAMVSLNLANKNKTTSSVMRYLSLASLFGAVAFINRNRDLSYAFIGGQVVFTLFGARHLQLYQQHLDKALWQYNKDILFPPVH